MAELCRHLGADITNVHWLKMAARLEGANLLSLQHISILHNHLIKFSYFNPAIKRNHAPLYALGSHNHKL